MWKIVKSNLVKPDYFNLDKNNTNFLNNQKYVVDDKRKSKIYKNYLFFIFLNTNFLHTTKIMVIFFFVLSLLISLSISVVFLGFDWKFTLFGANFSAYVFRHSGYSNIPLILTFWSLGLLVVIWLATFENYLWQIKSLSDLKKYFVINGSNIFYIIFYIFPFILLWLVMFLYFIKYAYKSIFDRYTVLIMKPLNKIFVDFNYLSTQAWKSEYFEIIKY